MSIVIKGAYYYDSAKNRILIPHYTSEAWMVDCDIYLTKKEIGNSFFKRNTNDFIKYEDKKYYYAEYAPCITDNLELLSDLSELEHVEQSFDWNEYK